MNKHYQNKLNDFEFYFKIRYRETCNFINNVLDNMELSMKIAEMFYKTVFIENLWEIPITQDLYIKKVKAQKLLFKDIFLEETRDYIIDNIKVCNNLINSIENKSQIFILSNSIPIFSQIYASCFKIIIKIKEIFTNNK